MTDEQMALSAALFQKATVDRMLSGTILVNRNGLRWRDAFRQYAYAKRSTITSKSCSDVSRTGDVEQRAMTDG